MEHGLILIALACVCGFFIAWGVGANDVANAMGTSVGSRSVTIRQAIIIAAILEFAGAFLAGGEVIATIRTGILDANAVADTPQLLVYGMIASLLAASLWLLVASRYGWPVSTTHSIVGAIVGFALVGIGVDVVKWGNLGSIVSSWVISPLLAGSIAYALFISVQNVQKLILGTDAPLANAKKYVPYYIFPVGFIISLVTLFKGLTHVGLELSAVQCYLLAAVIGFAVMQIGKSIIHGLKLEPEADRAFHFTNVEKVSVC